MTKQVSGEVEDNDVLDAAINLLMVGGPIEHILARINEQGVGPWHRIERQHAK